MTKQCEHCVGACQGFCEPEPIRCPKCRKPIRECTCVEKVVDDEEDEFDFTPYEGDDDEEDDDEWN